MPEQRLCERHDVGLFDLDGVLYAGEQPVAHAAESLAAARQKGMTAAFVTNNASRTPREVAERLAAVGVEAHTEEIITSAQVAAKLLAERLDPGDAVLVVGDKGLVEAIQGAGLEAVREASACPVAVVQGHSTSTGWAQLAEATIAIRAGAWWVATNVDATIPTDRGILAGNGAFVSVIADVLSRRPDAVAGKPDRAMHRASVERTGARRPLVVGDRLDTDIEGAVRSDCDSLYVMTGVSSPAEVLDAPAHQRPTYVASDLRALLRAVPSIADLTSARRCGRWAAHDHGIVAAGEQGGADDAGDYLALACALAWSGLPHGAGDEAARRAEHELALTG